MKKSMKVKASIITAFIMVINVVLNGLLPLQTIYAEEQSGKVDSIISMKINSKQVNLNDVIKLSPGDKVEFKVNYDQLDPKPKEGDVLKFDLPSMFTDIITPSLEELNGHFSKIEKEGNLVKFICSSEIKHAVEGFIEISATVGLVEYEDFKDVTLDIGDTQIALKTVTYPSGAKDKLIDKKVNNSDDNYTIEPNDKTGEIVGQTVPYSVFINEKYTKLEDVVFTDYIPKGMELVDGSLKITKDINGVEVNVDKYEITSANPLTIKLGDINHKHKISYSLKVNEVKDSYINLGEITSKNTEKVSDSVKAIPKNDEPGTSNINKLIVGEEILDPNEEGSLIGRQVDYRVEINDVKEAKTGAVFEDVIPQGMNLIKDSVKIYKEEREVKQEITDSFKENNKIIIEDKSLKVDFGDIKTKYSLEYSSVITEDKGEYNNNATLVWDGGKESSSSIAKLNKPKPGSGNIDKTVNGDKEVTVIPNSDGSLINRIFDYSILVNNELEEKQNLNLNDNIPLGMEIVKGSVKISKEIGASKYIDVTKSTNFSVESLNTEIEGNKQQKLNVDFGTTSDRYKVEYKIKITENKNAYDNRASIVWKNNEEERINNSNAIVYPKGEIVIGNTDIKKQIQKNNTVVDKITIKPNSSGIYNQTINYLVTINDKFTYKSNANFSDIIPNGMKLVEDSLRVIKVDRYESSTEITSDLKDNNKIRFDEASSKLSIDIGNITDRFKYVVIYQTQINDYMPNGWINSAKLIWDENKEGTVSSTIVNPTGPTKGEGSLSKSIIKNSDIQNYPNEEESFIDPNEDGSYVGKKVHYSIIVNNELTAKNNLKIEDFIPVGMKLLTDSVKVYRDTGNVYEDITNKDIILITKGDNNLKVEFGETSSRYKIVYETEITSNENQYENKVSSTWNGGEANFISKIKQNIPRPGTYSLLKLVKKESETNYQSSIKETPNSIFVGSKFDYEILVNDKLENKEKTILEDFLPEGMKLDETSIRVYQNYGGNVYGDVTNKFKDNISKEIINIDGKALDKLTINFGQISERYKVTYKGQVSTLVETGYDNSAKLIYNDDKSEEISSKININLEAITPGQKDALISKKSLTDHVSKIGDKANYAVTINSEHKRFVDLKFEDIIPSGMDLIIEGFQVIEITDQGVSKDITNELLNTNSPKAILSSDKLSINFGQTYSTYTIKYNCQVNKLYATYSNEAKLISREVTKETKNELKYEVKSGAISGTKTVNKQTILDGDSQDVEYTIKVWSSSAVFPANFLKIEDKLDSRLVYKGFESKDFNATFDEATNTLKISNKYDIQPATYNDAKQIVIKVGFENVDNGQTIRNIAKINNNKTLPVDVKKGYKFEGIKISSLDKKPLKDAEFELYKVNQSKLLNLIPTEAPTEEYLKTVVSDENGKISSSVKEPGKYILREIKAPAGYILSSKDIDFEIKDAGTVLNIGNIENAPKTTTIKVKKVDEKNPSITLANAEFALNDGDNVVCKATTDSNGIATFENIKVDSYGKTYKLVEIKAPDNYILSDKVESVIVNIGVDDVVEFEFGNKYKGQDVTIKNFDNNNKLIEGSEYVIKDTDGNIVTTVVVGKEGRINTRLPEGKYSIEQTKAPNGYNLSKEVQDFEVKVTDGNLEINFFNQIIKGNVEILKVDSKDKSLLQGAEFTLSDKSKNIIEVKTSDENGLAIFKDIPYGEYVFEEIKAPKGYKLDSNKYEVAILENESVLKFTVENNKIEDGNSGEGSDTDNGKDPDGNKPDGGDNQNDKDPDGGNNNGNNNGNGTNPDGGNSNNGNNGNSGNGDNNNSNNNSNNNNNNDNNKYPNDGSNNSNSSNTQKPSTSSPATGDEGILLYSLACIGSTGLLFKTNRRNKK